MAKDPARYVALPRGINVGGHQRVAMADLRDLLTRPGPPRIYLWCPNGISDSQSVDQVGTARNWNTVTKLLTLADA